MPSCAEDAGLPDDPVFLPLYIAVDLSRIPATFSVGLDDVIGEGRRTLRAKTNREDGKLRRRRHVGNHG